MNVDYGLDDTEMDLQSATRVVGFEGKLARFAALLCFAVAGGLLLSSHSGQTGSSNASVEPQLATSSIAPR